VKAIKVSATAKIAAKTSKKNQDYAPKKKSKLTTASVAMIQEKAKANLHFTLIEEQFYSNPQKRIKGACEMLLEGAGPFAALYNVIEGKFDQELVLKASCCGKDTASLYVAGVHFTIEDLHMFGVNKKVKGWQLWLMGLTVMRLIKKAISIVPKLMPSICSIDKNCAVIGCASGKNQSSLMQFIDNGMFALSLNESGVIDDIGSDEDDDEILGATSVDGMPMTRDDALIEHMSEVGSVLED